MFTTTLEEFDPVKNVDDHWELVVGRGLKYKTRRQSDDPVN
jgi:hypothetical protein